MKFLFVALLLCLAYSAQANLTGDTIFWHISYGKAAIVDGNLNSRQPVTHELTVRSGSVKDLTISFVYDVQPQTSSLTIKEKNEVLRMFDHDPVMGSHFVVPIRELINTHQPDVRYELDFYYTDDRGIKERKFATLIFIFK